MKQMPTIKTKHVEHVTGTGPTSTDTPTRVDPSRFRSHFKTQSKAQPTADQSLHTDGKVSSMAAAENMVHVLHHHAQVQPDRSAFVYLLDGEAEEEVLTFAQLDQHARAIAVRLLERNLAGERVLLAYPSGVDFIAGFFGCLYAGCVAVPVALPHKRTLDPFRAICTDADARAVLSTAAAAAQHHAMIALDRTTQSTIATILWLATDEMPRALAEHWKMPDISPQTLAMLQYTSGSTSEPKGVMISHANLMHNTRAIEQAFSMDCDTGMFWLPAYHDMGLIGGVLEPILAGITCVLMAPSAFLQQPIRWLAAISKYRATISGGPNFAYDLCLRKITDEQLATLDLSCWSLAFVGAEPVQAQTLEKFADRFAPCGFDAAAFYPCYGLAESTLMVSGTPRGSGAKALAFDYAALCDNRAVVANNDDSKTQRLVSCGIPITTSTVVIADPQSCRQISSGRIGEVWIKGASVAQGYWNNPSQSEHTFSAQLRPDAEHAGKSSDSFLRTGDMGFVLDGELYLTGRLDDLLIIRGMNHHPQDMESTIRQSHSHLENSFGAVFTVAGRVGIEDAEIDQRIVLVQEIARNFANDCVAVIEAARGALLDEHGLSLDTIVFVRCGTIPRTTSGKVQRRACRAAFIARTLTVLSEHQLQSAEVPCNTSACVSAANDDTLADDQVASSFVLAAICQHALALSGAALSDVTPDTRLTALGLDSLQRAELATKLEKTFACRLPDTDFNPTQTLGELAHAVQKHLSLRSLCDAHAMQIPVSHYDFNQFPEYVELKRYERMLKSVAGANPYFRVDQGGTSCATISRIDGRERINFGVYDYIGLAHDRRVTCATKTAIDRYGTSAGASRLVSGEKQVHRDLEQTLASFLGAAAAIVFVSGHATNVTTIGHLMGSEDLIVHDMLAHNSIIQGAQLSGATRRVFAHNDWQAMDTLLSEVRHRYRRVLIAIEGAYSMDGDFPDLPRFVELKKKHKALMLVDEAHSLGTMGETGRGIGEHWDVAREDVDLWMGTLSKTLASCGGYIAGSSQMVEYLGYTAPGFVYSVGLSPGNAAAALAALNVLQAEPQRVTKLRKLSALFLNQAKARGLNTGSSAGTPVIPVIIGSSVKSLRLARVLFDQGINVQPILHPAVPEQMARLRFFITTNHTEKQIRDTVNAVADGLAKL